MNGWIQDVRYALRQLRKAPGFTVTAVSTLALGIGANAAIFNLVHAVLLQNLPGADPNTLVRVGDKAACCVYGGVPVDDNYSLFLYDPYLHLRDDSPEFEQMAAMQAGIRYNTVTARSTGDTLPHPSQGEFISGNYFQTFGLKPYAGRLIAPSDDVPGSPMVAVISYRAWERDYAQDLSVVGRVFALNTHPTTIVGIAPPSFMEIE